MPESDEEEAEPLCAISTVDTNSTTVNVVRLAMQLHCLRGINLSLCDPFILDALMLPPSAPAGWSQPTRESPETRLRARRHLCRSRPRRRYCLYFAQSC